MSQIEPQEMIRIKEACRDELRAVLYALPQKRSKEARNILQNRIGHLEALITELYQRILEKVQP